MSQVNLWRQRYALEHPPTGVEVVGQPVLLHSGDEWKFQVWWPIGDGGFMHITPGGGRLVTHSIDTILREFT